MNTELRLEFCQELWLYAQELLSDACDARRAGLMQPNQFGTSLLDVGLIWPNARRLGAFVLHQFITVHRLFLLLIRDQW
ncbi:MAG: hypothetical protein EKK47_02475 [Burkholderiales bacterium]|nr:MAG: hypothetical protein EKK47_02475 [Burkholderiales bacterium]